MLLIKRGGAKLNIVTMSEWFVFLLDYCAFALLIYIILLQQNFSTLMDIMTSR